MLKGKYPVEMCPMAQTMQRIGGKWKLVVLAFVASRPHRFKELERAIGTISPKMLTIVLEELETDGLLIRTVKTTRPLAVEYSLTPKGAHIKPVLEALHQFGAVMQAVKIDE